ncbi:MAG: hypothetical protein SFW35_05660 [Chitinophagales bacterium]|nr:hypothetical protein [Chitinophagales bacterium]
MRTNFWALLSIVLAVLSVNDANACGACGCALSNYNPELLVNVGNHSIGIMNTFKAYGVHTIADGHSTAEGVAGTPLHYKQWMSQHELRGAYYPHPRVLLFGSLPLNHLTLWLNDEKQKSLTGLGDAILVASYRVLNETDTMQKNGMLQRLQVSAGIKLPTGPWKNLDEVGNWEAEHQLGTGSVDFIIGANYFFKRNNFGFMTDVSYKINTTNKKQYHFANNLNADISCFYLKRVKKVSLAPNIGMQVEHTGSDSWYGKEYYKPTGGTILLATAGMDIYYRNVGISLEYFHPSLNKLQGVQMELQARAQVGIKYIINPKPKQKQQQ